MDRSDLDLSGRPTYSRCVADAVRPAEGAWVLALDTPTLAPATATNTLVVGGDRLMIIEPATPHAREQARLDALLAELQAEGRTLAGVIVTHHHADHIGYATALRDAHDIPIFAHPETAARLEFSIDEAIDKENFAAVFEGYVRVLADNVYIFELTSDDGSKLLIDGKLVIDHDGLHSPEAKNGEAPLAAGLHRIRIEWFNKTGGTALRLRWAQLASSELADLPADSLMHSIGR